MARRQRSVQSLTAPALVLLIAVVAWAGLLTVVLADDRHQFYCRSSPCSAADVGLLFARAVAVMLWLLAPYVAAGWLLCRCAPRLNRALPRWLRWHPRGAPAMRMFLGILIGIGHAGVLVATYAMLHHNPQDDFCPSVSSVAEANFFSSNGPCYIGLGELALLLATNVGVASMFVAPFAAGGWLVTLMALRLERAGKRWLGRRPFD